MSLISILTGLLLVSFSAFARPPLRDPGKLFEAQTFTAVPVEGTHILIKDLRLLRADFTTLGLLTPDEIDRVLSDCAGYIAEAQTMNHIVSETIPVDPRRPKIQAYKPGGYGRAMVLQCLDGLIDIKGSGSLHPGRGAERHNNGLMGLGEALREYIFEKMLAIILRHAGYDPGTVGIYAVMDLNFNVYLDGAPMRAAMVLRRAHSRLNAMGKLPKVQAEYLESLLRQYGILSDLATITYKEHTLDRNNVQGAADGAMVDAGGVRVFPGGLVQSPAQPNPDLRLPFAIWGYSQTGDIRDRDNIFLLATQWAHEWMAGRMNERQIDAAVEELLSPLRTKYGCGAALSHPPRPH